MISLKRNDKIIILAAIIVVVIAGVGVAMYKPSVTPYVPPSSTTSTSQSFNVSWILRNASLDKISEFASKKTPFTSGIEIPQGNIKSITFNMSWIDEHTTFFGRAGLDTLTLEITTPDGDVQTASNTSAPKTKEGRVSVVLTSNIIPPVGPIPADDYGAAQAQLNKKPYLDDSWMNRNFSYKVICKIGEKRIIPRLRDKGDTFTLQISYQYYQGIIQQHEQMKSTGNSSAMPPQENPWEPPYMSMIISTGCGRFV
jgi:hypothetical protein